MQTSQERENRPSTHMNSTLQSKLLEIEHKFKVPIDQLFEAFTTSEALKNWWWPEGLYSDHIEMDFREGGKYFINMKGFNRSDSGGGGMTGQFEEIIDNKRIVMTDQFADEKGRAISAEEAKMPGTWPKRGYITFDFDSVDDNTSNLKLSQAGIPNEVQKDCIQGWSEIFNKLEKYLNDRKH
ncbi:MAG: SRPBCC domain-containing protein [Bacteriovorax sp.]|nr:SRPBCC domain-containing protein [Bacteriovorax sp.]